MNRRSSASSLVTRLARWRPGKARPAARRDPRRRVRWILGLLAAANIAAFLLLWKPWGGTPADLDRELADLRAQLQRQQATLGRLRVIVGKVEKARQQSEKFYSTYFMDRRTASSAILKEIGNAAREAGLKPREHAFLFEEIEGSDTLSMMTVSANYEGTYADLVQFVNLVDRSARFLIIDNIQAAPLREAGMLSARFKMNAFVRDQGTRAPLLPAAPAAEEQPAAESPPPEAPKAEAKPPASVPTPTPTPPAAADKPASAPPADVPAPFRRLRPSESPRKAERAPGQEAEKK